MAEIDGINNRADGVLIQSRMSNGFQTPAVAVAVATAPAPLPKDCYHDCPHPSGEPAK